MAPARPRIGITATVDGRDVRPALILLRLAAPSRSRRPLNPRDRLNRQADAAPRIIGGLYRGRKLSYSGDPRTRPMKDRVREAVFNLLGPGVVGMQAVDLFAGTGALGLEALSRGAAKAILVEQHFPTAELIRRNADMLGAADRCRIHAADTFIWAKRTAELGSTPSVFFCSPPYDFYVDRLDAMLELIAWACRVAAVPSVIVVEADQRFDMGRLPDANQWDIRPYPPAVVALRFPVANCSLDD